MFIMNIIENDLCYITEEVSSQDNAFNNLIWNNNDDTEILSISSSESKLWMVPRLDTRAIYTHRHPKDTSFPSSSSSKDLPLFVIHAKELWNKSFNNIDQQQPMKPSGVTSGDQNKIKYLGKSSIKTGWDHLKVAFYQIGKIYPDLFKSNEEIKVGSLYWEILRPKTLKSFITKQYNDGYQLQTITNRVQMMERFLWIVVDESYYEDDNTKGHLPSIKWVQINKKVLIDTCSFYAAMFSELKKGAKQKTKERNTKENLEEQDKWITIDELVTITNKEYDEVIHINEKTDDNFIRIRSTVLLCLSTYRTPLRPQNWSLLVCHSQMKSLEERKILNDYNQKYYSNKNDFITGFLIKPNPEEKTDHIKIKFIDHKTVSSRGVKEQLIKEEHCLNIIKLYLEFRDYILIKNHRDINEIYEFIINTNGLSIKPGKAFTFATNRLFGKTISQGIYRKIFETGAHEAGLSESDRKLYSEHALHTMQVAEDYYVSKDLHKTEDRVSVIHDNIINFATREASHITQSKNKEKIESIDKEDSKHCNSNRSITLNDDHVLINTISNRLQNIHPLVKKIFVKKLRAIISESFNDEQQFYEKEDDSPLVNTFHNDSHSVDLFDDSLTRNMLIEPSSSTKIEINNNVIKNQYEIKEETHIYSIESINDNEDENKKELEKSNSTEEVVNFVLPDQEETEILFDISDQEDEKIDKIKPKPRRSLRKKSKEGNQKKKKLKTTSSVTIDLTL